MYSIGEQGGGPFHSHANTAIKSRNLITVDFTNKETILTSSHSNIKPIGQD